MKEKQSLCVWTTTLQTGDEDYAVENATEERSDDETLENSGEEPVEHSSDEAVEEMDRLSLPLPPPFKIEASDLYSEWTHYAALPWLHCSADIQHSWARTLPLQSPRTRWMAILPPSETWLRNGTSSVLARNSQKSRSTHISQRSGNWRSPAISLLWTKRGSENKSSSDVTRNRWSRDYCNRRAWTSKRRWNSHWAKRAPCRRNAYCRGASETTQ